MSIEDYFSAGIRHYADSEVLAGRTDNSTYLAGYVLECGLKQILHLYGHSSRAYGHDVTTLQGRALTLAVTLSPGAARYRVDLIANLEKAAQEWSPEMRYWTTGDVPTPEQAVLAEVSNRIFTDVFLAMILDGVERRLR